MKILAIETSCDETAIALLDITGPLEKPDIKVLGNSLFSQAHLHEKYGGVYPNLAKREHEKNLPILLEQVLNEAKSYKLEPSSFDAIAVTQGPGLEPALWTGITFAKELGKKWGKPVVPVDHMEGHIWSVLYGGKSVNFPALALLVSGGHTELVLVKDFGSYEILGKTRDDAVGEAFDKVARLLGLPYPGGPQISALAEVSRNKRQETINNLPHSMRSSGDLDFSYSGLKTAVLYTVKGKELTQENKEEISRQFEDRAIEQLIHKTKKALNLYPVSTLIVAGGVAANKHLRKEVEEEIGSLGIEILFPERDLITDNAVMIGIAGFIRVYLNPELLKERGEIRAQGNLEL